MNSISQSTLEKFTTFGDLLRFLRRRVGITQMELSIAVGYSDAQISRLEQNLRLPDIPTIQARFIPALDLQNEPQAADRLLDLAANVRREDAPGTGMCPYKGLNHFEEIDADLFVGREVVTSKLTERLISLTLSGVPETDRFLAVVGASGSGKSSLVRAGVVPTLRWDKRSADWQIHVLTPTARPLESLAAVLTRDSQSVTETAMLMDDLARDSRSLHLFAKRKINADNSSRMLLVVDQFEEVFALCRSEEERAAFISNLLTAESEADGPVIVLIAMRADFYPHCAGYIQLREALSVSQEYIGAMTDDELRRAIEEPAKRGQWELEDGLVDLLLHDVGHEPGALPLLSHALMETWLRRRGRKMTLSGYTSSGGVRGAIAETAESVFVDQFSREQYDIARRIFLRLTELGDETTAGDTRRRAEFKELILKPEEKEITESVLKVLADARLIITEKNSVEVAHEALIREWPRLRGWLEDNHEGLRLHRRLTEASQEWDALERDAELLYRGARLSQTLEWAASHRHEMNELECEFLDASSSLSEKEAVEREEQQKRELEAAQKLANSEKQRAEEQTAFAKQLGKRAMYLAGAFVIALLMTFTALYFGSRARTTAVASQNDKRIATSRELAAASLNNINVDPERSILLALQSISTTQDVDGTVLPESLEALHQSIISSPIRMTLYGQDAGALSVAYSPDGNQLASIGYDGTVVVWDAVSGNELFRVPGTSEPNDFVTSKRVAYSPDGKQLIACDRDQIKIYDANTGAQVKSLKGHEAYITSIAITTDGKFIASGDLDGAVFIWNVNDNYSPLQPSGHTNAIENLTFSPNGEWLVTLGDDAAMRIWAVPTGELLQEYTGFQGVIVGGIFSPDGNRFAFSDGATRIWSFDADTADRTAITDRELITIPGTLPDAFSPDGNLLAGIVGNDVKIWDSATGSELFTLTGHTEWVIGLAFSPDGTTLASASLDGTVKIWSLTLGKEISAVSVPSGGFGTRIAYNPSGQELIINGGDGTAKLWNVETGDLQSADAPHTLEVMSVDFSPDGERFATGSLDGTAIVWSVSTGKALFTVDANENGVRDVAFNPDGTLLATGGFDGTAKVWNAETGELIYEITGHQGLVLGVAFSPDGNYLATSSTDTTAKIWDAKTGNLVTTLTGHEGGIRDVACSSDGSIIATASADGTVILWDAVTGSTVQTLTGNGSALQVVAFSLDGKMIAAGSEDNTARVWEVSTGEEILVLPGSTGGVTGIAFNPSYTDISLAVAGGDGIVRIFLLDIDELTKLAHSRVTRALTTGECQKYLHVEQCP